MTEATSEPLVSLESTKEFQAMTPAPAIPPRPLKYFFAKHIIGRKGKKLIFANKVIAVYAKGLKVVPDRSPGITLEELPGMPLLKYVDIREFQFYPLKNVFRFFYRSDPSTDPLPEATDLLYEFELALVEELQETINEAINRLASKRKSKGDKQTKGTVKSQGIQMLDNILSHTVPSPGSSPSHTTAYQQASSSTTTTNGKSTSVPSSSSSK